MSDVQRWTSNSVAPSDAGGFVAYGDYLELRTKLAESQAREVKMRGMFLTAVEFGAIPPFSLQELREQFDALPPDGSALREQIEAAKAEEREALSTGRRIPTSPPA